MAERRPRILIVDDHEQNRYVLCRILSQANYECQEATLGSEALAQATTLPDIIVLDVNLPDISGFEVCRRIKSDPVTSQISILQISASMTSSENKMRALEAGADGYLIHPIDGTVLVATVRSLLRLRTAEGIARDAAKQWQATFDALSEGVALINSERRLIRWNAAFAVLCGPDNPLWPGDDAAALLERLIGTSEPLFQNVRDREPAEFTLGNKVVHLGVRNVGGDDADPFPMVLIASDLTDRRLAEYAVRTAEKIAATGKLANVIAHEINNPLESLTNLLYLAQTSASVETIQQFLAGANEELARVSRITRQILSFHRDTLKPVAVDIGSLVADVIDLFERSAVARGVRLVYDRQPSLTIYGYPGQLRQVFGNLVRNATEAAKPDTEIRIRVRPVRRAGREGTRVTIHDRGDGIPKDVQKMMFDPFFTTKELRGSGLGLWVSKNLVMEHQGSIRFRSSTRPESSGTTFEVFLPVGGLNPEHRQHDEI
ncbi:MAG TPA: ATP-binding protein [Acidobacteriaceae bacterium]|jgi:signal transduction histidine kinase|nr:ATP-binding protein [Acidobacteriaceae bacterium]